MPRFTFRQLELFAALSDHRTLGAAARQMHISESALSHAMSELEAAVGEQLCIRKKAKGMYLTPTGRHFAKRARELLRDADALADSLGELRDELVGPVSLGCYTGLATGILPAVLEGMTRLHPKVTISIAVGDHSELLPKLEDGTLDIAIVYDIDLPSDLERRVIYATEGMVLLAAKDPLGQQQDVDLAELVTKPLIMLDTALSKDSTELVFAQRGLKPTVGAIVPQIDLVRALVGRGLGYSLLMSRPNQNLVSSEGKGLVSRHLRPRADQTSVVAVWQKETMLTSRSQAVIEYAVGALATSRSAEIP